MNAIVAVSENWGIGKDKLCSFTSARICSASRR